jgi:deoxyribonuclease-4
VIEQVGLNMLVGAHVSFQGGIEKAIFRGHEITADAIQIFLSSPRTWGFSYKAGQANPEPEIPVFIHAPYLINLASPEPEVLKRSIVLLKQTLVGCGEIGGAGVVLHPGSAKGLGFAIDRWVEALGEARQGAGAARLILENSAGQGGSIGADLDQLADLYRYAASTGPVGICLDTQHLYAYGYPLDSIETKEHLNRLIPAQIPPPDLLHLNDSKTPLGSRHDRHENLGEGAIGRETLSRFLNLPLFKDVPAVLEVPGNGKGPRKEDIELARQLIP